jgi:hypothetical protein
VPLAQQAGDGDRGRLHLVGVAAETLMRFRYVMPISFFCSVV